MKYLLTITLSSLISITSFSATLPGNEGSININYPNNRYPLASKPYIELPIGDVKPAGWLKIQMERMCTGMTGHLDSIYTKVMGPRNGWLGGDGDVWERGPYWIDGLLPLAYIMNDEALIQKVKPLKSLTDISGQIQTETMNPAYNGITHKIGGPKWLCSKFCNNIIPLPTIKELSRSSLIISNTSFLNYLKVLWENGLSGLNNEEGII